MTISTCLGLDFPDSPEPLRETGAGDREDSPALDRWLSDEDDFLLPMGLETADTLGLSKVARGTYLGITIGTCLARETEEEAVEEFEARGR